MTPKHYRPLDDERGPRKVGESLDRVVPGARAFSTLVATWPDLVGEALAGRIRPRGLHDGTLVIAADDGASLTSAKWLEHDLLARFQEAVGAANVRAVRFVVQRS